MKDILPPAVRAFLSDRYVAGVANAEAGYYMHRADEDSVTGGLGQAIATRDPIAIGVDGRTYLIRIWYDKVRGRGRGAPEKPYGTDGIFQITISTWDGRIVFRKGLPFQSKNEWHGHDRSLDFQAQKIKKRLGAGIVIDYGSNGYGAYDLDAVIHAHGKRADADRDGARRPLGQVLGRDFVECLVGERGLYFDPEAEQFANFGEEGHDIHRLNTSILIDEGR